MVGNCAIPGCVREATARCSACKQACCGSHHAVVAKGGGASSIVCDPCIARADEARVESPRRERQYGWQFVGAFALGGFVVGAVTTGNVLLGLIGAALAAVVGWALFKGHAISF